MSDRDHANARNNLRILMDGDDAEQGIAFRLLGQYVTQQQRVQADLDAANIRARVARLHLGYECPASCYVDGEPTPSCYGQHATCNIAAGMMWTECPPLAAARETVRARTSKERT